MDDLLEKLSKEQLNRFNKPWAKLDKGLRKNRIIFFCDNYDCTEQQKTVLKDLLLKTFNNNSLKNEYIDYDPPNNIIVTIKNLVYYNDEFSLTGVNIKSKPKARSKAKQILKDILIEKKNHALFNKKINISW